METKILALSGKKEAGKNTIANFLIANKIESLGLVDYIKVDEKGGILVPAINSNGEVQEGILDFNSGVVWDYLNQKCFEEHQASLSSFISLYSFADSLKEIAMSVFGLTYKQCYGSNEDKNSLTHIGWESFSKFLYPAELRSTKRNVTAREFLQYFGSEVCRKIWGDCWVYSTIMKIKQEGTAVAIITDCRFPNEVEGIQDVGGKVVRLMRNPHDDSHISETSLDGYVGFDGIIDNREIDGNEQNEELINLLKAWDWAI